MLTTLKSIIENIIPITDYYEMKEQRSINFDVYEEFTFEVARKLSEALKTNNIRLSAGCNPSCCDTCDFGAEYWISVEVRDIPFEFL